jgi:hypothetical protein
MNLALLTGIAASLALFYNQIASFITKLFSVIIIKVEVSDGVKDILLYHMRTNYRAHSFGYVKRFKAFNIFVKKIKRHMRVIFEMDSESMLFSRGLSFIYLMAQREGGGWKEYTGAMSVYFIRGTVDIEKLLKDALIGWRNQKESGKSRFRVVKHFGETQYHDTKADGPRTVHTNSELSDLGNKPINFAYDDIFGSSDEDSFSTLCYNKEILDFANFVETWTRSREWYEQRNIPWKLGCLLYGKPGTGKSSYVRALALKLNMPIHVFDLSTLSNDELAKEWNSIIIDAPCIALFEDIDRVFDKDKNRNTNMNKQALTMDAILNCISGVDNSNGIISIATANKINRIDESLGIPDKRGISSRPGRFDKFLLFDVLDEDCRTRLASIMLGDDKELVKKIVALGKGETGAQFSKRCSDLALKVYWDDKKTK